MKTKTEVQEFLKELTELSDKHGLVIHGCGCCGSPRIDEKEKDGGYGAAMYDDVEGADYLTWKSS